MKLKIEVDIENLVEGMFENAEYDSDLGIRADINLKDDIKSEIIYETKQAVLKEIKEPIKKDISDRVKILVEDSYKKEVEKAVEDFVENGKVRINSYNEDEITTKEWIKNQFKNNFYTSGKLEKIVKQNTEELAKEIRDRYDLLFASSLVSNLNDQGLLKEGVFKAIMKGE